MNRVNLFLKNNISYIVSYYIRFVIILQIINIFVEHHLNHFSDKYILTIYSIIYIAIIFVSYALSYRKYIGYLLTLCYLSIHILVNISSNIGIVFLHNKSIHYLLDSLYTNNLLILLLDVIILILLLNYKAIFNVVFTPLDKYKIIRWIVYIYIIYYLIDIIIIEIRHYNRTHTFLLDIGKDLNSLFNRVFNTFSHSDINIKYNILYNNFLNGLWICTVFIIIGLIFFYILYRDIPLRKTTKLDYTLMRNAFEANGHYNSLNYFSFRGERKIIWSKGYSTFLSYVVTNGVMISSGDPIGLLEEWYEVMQLFYLESKKYGLDACIIHGSENAKYIWSKIDPEYQLPTMELGNEAIVDVQQFTLSGSKMRNCRQMINRILRKGYYTRIDLIKNYDDDILLKIHDYMNLWRRIADVERGYSTSLGSIDKERYYDCLLAICYDSDNNICGFMHLVPWNKYGFSLDIMRWDTQQNIVGINELLIYDTIQYMRKMQYDYLSLHLVVFGRAFIHSNDSYILHAFKYILVKLSKRFQMQSLYAFNRKFDPKWHRKYLLYTTNKRLLHILLAIMHVESLILFPRINNIKQRLLSYFTE